MGAASTSVVASGRFSVSGSGFLGEELRGGAQFIDGMNHHADFDTASCASFIYLRTIPFWCGHRCRLRLVIEKLVPMLKRLCC